MNTIQNKVVEFEDLGIKEYQPAWDYQEKLMKDIIIREVIDKLDHKNVNLDVDFMEGKMASTEVIAMEIFHILKPFFEKEKVFLHAVRLHETENNYVEYFGE